MLRNLLITVFALCVIPADANAGEFPIIFESTVVGQNWGYPSGTPEEGMTRPGSLDLVVESAFFTKNLEILTEVKDIEVGRTYTGYRAPIRLRYRPHERVTLEGGVSLGHNYGDDDDLDAAEPVLRLVYEPLENLYIVTGTLIRTHPAHDALYDDAIALRGHDTLLPARDLDEGLQIRLNREQFKSDTWINWRVRETTGRPEEFDMGSVNQFRLGGIYIDGQLLWVHTGGQQNNPNDPPAHKVEHNLGLLGGASYGISAGPLLKDIRIGGYYIHDSDSPDNESGIADTEGSGFEGRITADVFPKDNFNLHLFGSYFKGDDLLCRQGDPLYRLDEYAQVGTNLLFRLPAGGGGLALEFGLALQALEGSLEHTEQLYLTWGKAFTLIGRK